MLARRLMIAMLVALGLASLAATLAPMSDEGEERSTTSTRAPERPREGRAPAPGRLVRARIDAQADRPEAIPLDRGDQLAIRVDSEEVLQIAIPAFGQLADVQPGGPARFDLLATRPGTFPVRILRPARTIARIEVRDRGRGG